MKKRMYVKPVFDDRILVSESFLTSVDIPGNEYVNINEHISNLHSIIHKFADYSDYKFSLDVSGSWDTGYNASMEIYGVNEETDEQYEKRKANFEMLIKYWEDQCEEDGKLNEKREKAEFLRLNKKYGKSL